MFYKSFTAVALLAVKATATIWYAGVAESGGEFGVWSADSSPAGLPGTFGSTYAFISKPAIDIYVDKHKINTFRVALLLERLCPLALGLGARFDEKHFGELADAINYITVTKGAYCILDPHNYMRYNNPHSQPFSGSVIGNTSDVTAATTAQFGQFWGELAKRFVNNEKVIFGLMNEPHDMDNNLVLANNQAAIDSIRAVGAKQLIIAPGGGWTGGHAWIYGYPGNAPPNSEVMLKIRDPLNNTAFDIHEYSDIDYSGGKLECANTAEAGLAGLTTWLRTNGYKAMITEFGTSNTTQCEPYLTGMLRYMENNPEYIGWTAWAAGPLWGQNSPCCTGGAPWGSLEPGSKAADGGPSLYDTVWVKLIQPLLPKTLQKTGISHVKGPGGGVSPSSSATTKPRTSTTSKTTKTTKTSTTKSRTTTTVTTKRTTRVKTSALPTTTAADPTIAKHWQQCGGVGFVPKTCEAPWKCVVSNPIYSQCL